MLLIGVIAATGLAAFSLGRLSAQGEAAPAPVVLYGAAAERATSTPSTTQGVATESVRQVGDNSQSAPAQYVGSRNGTAYHLPWCPGAAKIKEENKVWFASKAEAEAAGYKPAGNCKGI